MYLFLCVHIYGMFIDQYTHTYAYTCTCSHTRTHTHTHTRTHTTPPTPPTHPHTPAPQRTHHITQRAGVSRKDVCAAARRHGGAAATSKQRSEVPRGRLRKEVNCNLLFRASFSSSSIHVYCSLDACNADACHADAALDACNSDAAMLECNSDAAMLAIQILPSHNLLTILSAFSRLTPPRTPTSKYKVIPVQPIHSRLTIFSPILSACSRTTFPHMPTPYATSFWLQTHTHIRR